MSFQAQYPGHVPPPKRDQKVVEKENEFRQAVLECFQLPQGQKLLEVWADVYLNAPTWQPGSPDGFAAYRAGQNSLVHLVKNILQSAKEGASE